ncbi:hypothetical protein OHA27_29155 [Streptomyces sp. NBC_01619]|uniref:hypothetical protein n=1 Tax=Streptomyces sp. NBC_01619 TaxID=2975901 RepID=UPI00225BBC9C|nr:hypothetical protein [Streptomyces sp. NBC_01619]MCX4514316.1 hypothetical protein [Streptomyces sp. NBC_01619]
MRFAAGAAGVGLMGYGAWLLFGDGGVRDPWDVVIWLAGAVLLHDGLIAPAVLAVGLLLAALPARGVLRAALVVCGALTLIALPPLLRPGAPTNPTALPLDYLRNWLLTLAVVVALAAAALLLPRAGRTLSDRRARRRARRDAKAREDADGAGGDEST